MLCKMTLSASSSLLSSPAVVSWVGLAGKLAPVASLVVFLSPMPTIEQISRKRSVGSLPLLPYSSMAANAFIWTCYGLLLNESKIWIANGVGFLLSLYYCARFIKFAPKAAPTLPGTVSQHVRFATALIAATAMMSLSPLRSKTKIIGLSGVVVCSALFMSPLAALKTVLDTKSAKSIPLPLSLATIANGLLWTTVGALELHDANVVIPSALGLASGIAQLVLKLIYGNSKPNVYPVPI